MTMASSPRDSRESRTSPYGEASSPEDRTPCTDQETSSAQLTNVDQPISMASSGQSGREPATDSAAPSKARSKRKTAAPGPAPLSINEKPVLTIPEAASLGAHSPGALRHLIFNSEAWSRYPDGKYRRSMGFDRCIIRPPGQRRVLIDRVKYLHWLNSNSEATS
jgi:hypothetical protein